MEPDIDAIADDDEGRRVGSRPGVENTSLDVVEFEKEVRRVRIGLGRIVMTRGREDRLDLVLVRPAEAVEVRDVRELADGHVAVR